MDIKIETSRLTLRPWGEEDIEQLTLGLNDLKLAKWIANHYQERGYGREAFEAKIRFAFCELG